MPQEPNERPKGWEDGDRGGSVSSLQELSEELKGREDGDRGDGAILVGLEGS